MTAIFIHDHYFVFDSDTGNYYDGSGGAFDQNLWKRYLSVFDDLIVVGRKIDKLPNKLVLSSYGDVVFELVDCINSNIDHFLKKNVIKSQLKESIFKADFAIIRLPSTLGYIAQSICLEYKKPYVLEVVGCPWDTLWNYKSLGAKLFAPLSWIKLRNATAKSKACIYVTQSFLQNRYPTKGKSIGISNVNIEDVIKLDKVVDFYSEYINEPTEEFKIGYIGTFHTRYKGHDVLLRALKKIIEQNKISNVKLYLVGTGDSSWILDEAKKLGIEGNVNIIGALNAGKDGILPFLDSIHLYIHPSKTEGLPRVVVEAMSRGRLALGSNAGGIPELLDTRFIHTAGNEQKLYQDICNIYDDRENWLEISKKNIQVSSLYKEDILQAKRVSFFQKQI